MEQLNRPDDVAANGRRNLQSSAAWRDIQRQFFVTGQAEPVLHALTQIAGRAVIEAYQSALAPVLGEGVAILATGGFGRGELFPFSEAGIVILRGGELPAGGNEAVAEFLRLLWERGLRPSHRSCSVGECLAAFEQDADFAMGLLDRRLLAGDAGLEATLGGKLAGSAAAHGRRLGETLVAAARARYAKYQNTPSHREPDVKEAPGGLRDLQLVRALAMLSAYQVEAPEALGEAAAFLSSIRCFLHYRALDDRNVFDASAQEAIVEQVAAGPTASLRMRDYYRHARSVFNEARHAMDSCEDEGGSLLASFRSWQSRISNQEFSVLHERVYLRHPGRVGGDPEMVFRLAEFVARHGIPPAPETERRLESARAAVASFCGEPRPLWPTLKAILSQPRAARAFRILQNTGLLPSIFPEWVRIEGVADPDRPYTIDEHTLRSMERVCELHAIADAARQRFSALFSGGEDQAVLLFALLFHLMGRAGEGTGLPGAAAALASAAGERVRMPASHQATVAFLIQHQAMLSDVVSGRDLDDSGTVRALSDSIGTIERLKLLSALTYADVASSCPEAMLPLRLEQLWQAYLATERELTRELEVDRIREVPASLPAGAGFIEGFPVRYLRAHTAAEIEAHARLYGLSRETGVAVQLDHLEGAYRLTVVAGDRQALFASLAGAISSFGLDIVKAEAFSNAKGIILDTFVFTDPRHTLELNPPEAERLQDLIRRVASGKTETRRLLRNRARRDVRAPAIEPQIRFDSEASEAATLIEILAEDRPGLLYSLANVFSSNGCSIDVVLVDTQGRRAVDVFYVAQGGGRLSSELQAKLKEELLSACAGDRPE